MGHGPGASLDEDLVFRTAAIAETPGARLWNESVSVDLATRFTHHGRDLDSRRLVTELSIERMSTPFAVHVRVRTRTRVRLELHGNVGAAGIGHACCSFRLRFRLLGCSRLHARV